MNIMTRCAKAVKLINCMDTVVSHTLSDNLHDFRLSVRLLVCSFALPSVTFMEFTTKFSFVVNFL